MTENPWMLFPFVLVWALPLGVLLVGVLDATVNIGIRTAVACWTGVDPGEAAVSPRTPTAWRLVRADDGLPMALKDGAPLPAGWREWEEAC